MLKCGKGGRRDAREEDRNLICVQIFCVCVDCVCVGGVGGDGDGEQQPRQCGGTSFISAHLVCSHSSLTPLTDELQRLAKLPADSALARSPSAQPPTPPPPPPLPCSNTIPSASYPGGCKTTQPEVTWRSRGYMRARTGRAGTIKPEKQTGF